MKSFLIFLFLSIMILPISAQKKLINNEAYKQWTSLNDRNYSISNDGKYVWYSFSEGYQIGPNTVVLVSLEGEYERHFKNAQSGYFTVSNKQFVAVTDSGIILIDLKSKKETVLIGAVDVRIPEDGDGTYIYFNKNSSLIVFNTITGTANPYERIKQWWINKRGDKMLIKDSAELQLVHLNSYKIKAPQNILTYNGDINNVLFSKDGKIIFSVKSNDSVYFYCYNYSEHAAKVFISSKSPDLINNYTLLDDWMELSADEKYLFFKVSVKKEDIKRDSIIITSGVDIWNYQDTYIQAQQLFSPDAFLHDKYTAIAELNTSKVLILEGPDAILSGRIGRKYALVKTLVNLDESYWRDSAVPFYQLIELSTGRRRSFLPHGCQTVSASLSPSEKYIIWNELKENKLYCYEIAQQRSFPLTVLLESEGAKRGYIKERYDIVNWLAEDSRLLLYGEYDIWSVDPETKVCINLTGGYGNKTKTQLKIAISSDDLPNYRCKDSLLLSGINDTSRYNGFYKIHLSSEGLPWIGVQAPYAYYFPFMLGLDRPPLPIKAKEKNVYCLTRQSCTEAKNIVITRDFNTFTPISDINPQKYWNWMTVEPLNWRLLDDSPGKGFLYKPEDFDSTRKYPIIFFYYEIQSNDCYKYNYPSISIGDLSIAWYVSNGYIVCIPDIKRISGKGGWCAVNSVVSVAKYLTEKYSWIDSKKMGLQGHSYGGYETNYLISQSNFFAAAQSSAGISNCVSGYGQLSFGDRPSAMLYENGQMNLVNSPWNDPQIYITNSPVFYVNKINTPLLMMHNKMDLAAPFSQSVELFTSLRRLNKPVWLLQYDGQGHALDGGSNFSLDFTMRQQQFFDHYLKNKPIPNWMRASIPSYLKGVKSGL